MRLASSQKIIYCILVNNLGVKYLCVCVCVCVHRCIYTLHDFPIAKFQGCILMNVKLWGKCLGTGEKMKQKRKKLTLFEQVSQLRVDTEFHRKNQVGSWPQARTVASAPCESVHTPCAHINSHPAGPLGPEVQLLLDCCCGQSLLGLLHAYKTEGWI